MSTRSNLSLRASTLAVALMASVFTPIVAWSQEPTAPAPNGAQAPSTAAPQQNGTQTPPAVTPQPAPPATQPTPAQAAPQPSSGQPLNPVVVNPPPQTRPASTRRQAQPAPVRQRAPQPVARPVAPQPVQPQLPAGVIVNPNLPIDFTTAGPVQGYKALTAVSATKTETPIEQIPQSIQVIPRSVIVDQQNITIDQALRNVSGVTPTNSLQTPAYESTRIRGFPAEQWLDGLTTYYNAGNRDSLVNVERIEVLKGPSAILYGGGAGAPLGGVVNVISKLPMDKAFGEFGVTLGSYRFAQPYFDINQPLTKDGTVLFRMTGEYTSTGSFVDVLDNKRYSFNPTLLLTNKTDTTFLIQGRVSDWKQQDYQGLPATGTITGNFRIDRDLFIGPADMPKSYSNVKSVTSKIDHTFNDIWSFSAQGRVSKTQFRELAQSIVGTDGFRANDPLVPPSYWALANADLFQEQRELTGTSSLLGKFNVGVTSNKLLFGADYSRITDRAYIDGAFVLDPLFAPFPVPLLVDLTNPGFPPFVVPGPGLDQNHDTYVTKGTYLQLQTDVHDRIHLLGAVRRTSLEIDNLSLLTLTRDTTEVTRYLPRVGAVVDLVKGFSVFASYSEGLKGNPFVHYIGAPKPEESKQTEGGIKFDTGTGFSGSAAIFEIYRTGVPVAVGLGSEAIGKERSRGFETDLLWQPNRNWSVLANYAYIDARLLNYIADVGGVPGNQLNFVPRESGRLWINYKFDPGPLRGWSVGAGVYAASGAYVDLANLYYTNSYYTIDAAVRYEDDYISASITAKNLTNETYFVPYNYFGGRVAPGDGRAVYGKFAVKYK